MNEKFIIPGYEKFETFEDEINYINPNKVKNVDINRIKKQKIGQIALFS